MIYIDSLTAKMIIYLAKKTQISLLQIEKLIIFAEFLDYADLFLKKSTELLSKHIQANKSKILLDKTKQLFIDIFIA